MIRRISSIAGIAALLLVWGCGGGNSSNGSGTDASPSTPAPATTTMKLSGSSFDFGSNPAGSSLSQKVVSVSNTGTIALTLKPSLSGDASYSIVAAQSCGATLAPGASCNVVVNYTPATASTPSRQLATLDLHPGNVPSGTASTVAISGISTMPVPVTTTMGLSASSFDFGDNLVGNTLSQNVAIVSNTGPIPLALQPSLTGDPSYSIVGGQSCGPQLAAGASCNVVVAYKPTTASVPHQQTAILNINPGNVPTGTAASVAISGTSGVLTPGTVTTTNNAQVALYTITPPFAGTVTVNFGRTTSYGLNTWAQSTPEDGSATAVLVAGMLANTTYHMQASITFPNGLTVTDTDHTFTTSAYPVNLLPQIAVTSTPGQTPQPGIEWLNPMANSSLQALATDLSGNVIWAYVPPEQAQLTNQIVISAPKLLPNGHVALIIAPGSSDPLSGPIPPTAPNVAREIDLAGNTVKQITMDELNTRLAAAGFANLTLNVFHHDITVLPNGHWLVLANTFREIVLNGDTTPTNVLGDVVVDLDTNLNPVWVWNEFDHLDVNRQPMGFPDWTHTNAIVYSPTDGNILVSMRHQNWVVKVDYNNGQGDGSILWHLGEGGDFTLEGGTDPTDWFYAQHFPSFTTSNTSGTLGLTLMDNGDDRAFPAGVTCGAVGAPPCQYSTVPVFQLNESAKTATLQFVQKVPTNLYNAWGGSSNQLANGDLEYDLCGLLTGTQSEVDEITQGSTPQTVWQMKATNVNLYRAFRIPSLYPGVQWSGQNF